MTQDQLKVKRLLLKMDMMREEYNKACLKAFPVGTEVSYDHGGTLRFGRVIDQGYGHRLKVTGVTGKEYWIETARIVEELV